MDGYLEQLKKFPSNWGRDARDHINPNTNKPSNYPISWAVINGNIFHPLVLKYKNNVKKNLHYPVVCLLHFLVCLPFLNIFYFIVL